MVLYTLTWPDRISPRDRWVPFPTTCHQGAYKKQAEASHVYPTCYIDTNCCDRDFHLFHRLHPGFVSHLMLQNPQYLLSKREQVCLTQEASLAICDQQLWGGISLQAGSYSLQKHLPLPHGTASPCSPQVGTGRRSVFQGSR